MVSSKSEMIGISIELERFLVNWRRFLETRCETFRLRIIPIIHYFLKGKLSLGEYLTPPLQFLP